LLFLRLWGIISVNTKPPEAAAVRRIIMENENLIPEEEETSVLMLTDENGVDVEFEYLDCIEYQDKEYLVLTPMEEDSGEIIILEVQPVDEETENYLSVEDEDVLNAVYAIFKERFQDILTFEE
jgi:uncharacterized protein YrzB (UPF0473 family)